MDTEELVRRVCAEVALRLQAVTAPAAAAADAGPCLLAVITGGSIGLEQGLEQLRRLQADGVRLTVVLSEAACRIAGAERVRTELGGGATVVIASDPYPAKALQQAQLVVVPVLTQNAAAKLAAPIADTMTSTLLMQALLQGKAVVAAVNAADPRDPCRKRLGMDAATPALTQALQRNLKIIETYGVRLTPVEQLAAQARRLAAPKPATAAAPAGRTLVDANRVKAAAQAGQTRLEAAPGAIVTPLAKDLASDCGIEIIIAGQAML
ncbi:MAG: flavoprotein [Sporomusaceae bacterium]|nr:flavoprotein [Sporomusaceae bacterium]